jgi:formate hydrogenlyase subunit 6/NADH:ubiquinone oxidoreductase subunit I
VGIGPGGVGRFVGNLHEDEAMNILRLIFENLKRGTLTARFPQKQPLSPHYRGLIQIDAERCVGCGQCAYSCPSCAMEVHRDGDKYQWKYDAAKCTFCGRCIERCKLHVLTQQSERPPDYSVEGELKQEWNMVRKRPVRPAATANSKDDSAKPATAVPAEKADTIKTEDKPSTIAATEPRTETMSDTPPVIEVKAEQRV